MFLNRIESKFAIFLIFLSNISVCSQIKYLFSHGLADTKEQAYKYTPTYKNGEKVYKNERYLIGGPLTTFNYPDATKRFWRVNFVKTSFGQDNEIACLKSNFEKIVQDTDTKKDNNNGVVIFGLSRGASAALNLTARYNPKKLKALVLESPFDSVGSIIDNQRKKLIFRHFSHDAGQSTMETIFRRYNRKGIQSIKTVRNIKNKKLPILIVCSKEDQLVPWKSSVRLYKALQKSGHTAVHLFVADHGKHSRILWDKNGDAYQSAVHAFYKKYNLPHNTTLASDGAKFI